MEWWGILIIEKAWLQKWNFKMKFQYFSPPSNSIFKRVGIWNSLALGCTCLPTPGGIYLWEGFWNGLLLGQTCEVPATARGNHFRPVVCSDSLDNLHMFICCTGIGLLVEEQKVAETVLADLIIPEIRLSVTTAVSSWGKFLPTNLPLTSPIGPFLSEMLS